MDTISPNNLGQRGYTPSDNTLATAPPPPAEVKIRTMRSDLESMAASGGGLPRFQNVKVSGISAEQQTTGAVVQAKSKSNLVAIVITIVILAVVAVAGWFIYSKYASNQSSASNAGLPNNQSTQSGSVTVPTSTPTAPVQVSTPSSTATTSPTSVAPFTHVSAFKIPADQTLAISFSSGAAQSATDLESYSQKIASLIATAKSSATFLEIDAKNTQGQDASIEDLLLESNAQVIAPIDLAGDFNPDATFFIYRDKNGSWPGYVIQVAQVASEASDTNALQGDTQAIETSVVLPNLFLTNPGTPSAKGFASSTIGGLPVRILSFTGGTVPSAFVYGWTKNHQYLILSTSQNGFVDAVKHLQ